VDGSRVQRLVDVSRPGTGRVPVPASLVATGASSVLAWSLTGDWIAAVALWVLWAGWHVLQTDEGPPVLPLAFTFQWVQVTAGLYYYALSGRRLPAMDFSEYRPMVLIGLGCLTALVAGLGVGMIAGRWRRGEHEPRATSPFGWGTLLGLYLLLFAVTGQVQALAWEIPELTQAILAFTYLRFALLFMMFWRLAQRRLGWCWIVVLLASEIAFGFTGYFAGFREPLMMAAVALLGVFDARRVKHWVVLGLLVATMLATGLMWLGIRTGYRQDFENEVFAASRVARAERLVDLSSVWIRSDVREFMTDLDFLVERLWAVYYPALAVSRVPDVLPHEDGGLLWRAVTDTFLPRFLFPDKGVLPSDSEMVIRYAGVWVAGAEQNTSIAFGYAAESYVDFGIPLMFLPVLLWGVVLGAGYQALLRMIHDRELAVAVVTVVLWLSLYLFERSWAKNFGTFATLMLYLGGVTILADRMLLRLRDKRAGSAGARPARPRGWLVR
jgi:hypothetical protein